MQRVLDELKLFYAAMGNAPDTVAALVVMAEALTARADPNLINVALNRCMAECRFPVRLPDIFSRIPGFDVDTNAEKRLAWETVERFVAKYVGNDPFGNYGPEHGWYPNNFPELSPRLLDTVRRTGGWSVYKRMSEEDFPHQQKRFFEEYQAWTEIQHVAAAKVLQMPSQNKPKLLVASFEPTKSPEAVQIPKIPPKDFFALPTVEELRDRAALQKARLEQYVKQKQASEPPEAVQKT